MWKIEAIGDRLFQIGHVITMIAEISFFKPVLVDKVIFTIR